MALNLNAVAPTNTNNAGFEKASAFLNFYVPRKDGTRFKLGAIPVRESNVEAKRLIAWLKEDDERIKVLVEKMIVDFRTVGDEPSSELDL